jgi:hypothetical protein
MDAQIVDDEDDLACRVAHEALQELQEHGDVY